MFQEMAIEGIQTSGGGETASGYESEDSSGNEVDLDDSGLLSDEEEEGTEKGGCQNVKDSELINEVHLDKNDKGIEGTEEDAIQAELSNFILKCKSVYKCRLCPRIVCLSEDTVKTHLNSKRHARSKKLLGEGRLKLMLNSDGEIEEDQETHAERHSRIVALAQEPAGPVKKDSGRQRQNRRRKKRLRNGSNKGKSDDTINPKKKSRKN